MSESIRITTTPNGGDKYLKVNLEQDFDFIEILSLRISQEDAYRQFCSDYGVIVGRVIIASGFGVPNAKVSVFIPIDDVDKNNPLIKGLYPYELVTDKNSDGIRYNLLPSETENNDPCFTPIGTFPTKREILDNEVMRDIYCKYYKFTTTTNHAGDFMIFGVPLGNYTVHVDADISDIGIASQKPYDLIRQGSPINLFENANKFKSNTNLDKLPQVKSFNTGVTVQPFWGDPDNCQIGITRLDIDLNYNIVPAAIFMGSIYGDQGKHSVNERCRPRKKMGEICEQMTNSGTIEILRKTTDNQIEQFDVDGGRVIDDDGTWAFQIPMNLDYVVTDEEGNIVPSSDPNIGVPTKASVRFRIGMDENSHPGRLRTRAKYLVPNNPQNVSEIDYNFDENTKDTSFKDLYWDKIYTVSNFISRYQKNDNSVRTRYFVAAKNVDACAGDKTPFPYNKVNTETNPIFTIFCVIIKIIGFIVYLLNALIFPIINLFLSIFYLIIDLIVDIINTIIDSICDLTFKSVCLNKLNKPDRKYIPCITIPCGDDNNIYAPGCNPSSDIDGGKAYDSSVNSGNIPTYYCNDSLGDTCSFGSLCGLDDCVAFQLAQALEMYQFDFYNDWVNGTLFSFLLKYKKKPKGIERFCEYDCSDFVNDPNYSGVDGNENGTPDNDCKNDLLLDTFGFSAGNNCDNCQEEYYEIYPIREGLIKKYNDEFYYASTTHTAQYKLYATDIVCLGSVFDCDWQGIPKLQQFLTPSSYRLPSDVAEVGTENGSNFIYETGMIKAGGGSKIPDGDFFNINCAGLHVNPIQALNIRHMCEIGVDFDKYIEDPITGQPLSVADGVIGSNEINELEIEIRDAFVVLNTNNNSVSSYSLPTNINTDFNLNNTNGYYNYTTIPDNGSDYVNFRGFTNDVSFNQPKHSFYFYFGLLPGKTAIEKMRQRYFIQCTPKVKDEMVLQTSTTQSTGFNGSLTFTFIGGHGPYTYKVTGPSGYTNSGTISVTPPTVTLNGLVAGSYTISGNDTLGFPVTKTINVTGPLPLYVSAYVLQNVVTAGVNNAVIRIGGYGGGIPPYTYALTDSNNVLAGTPNHGPLSTTPLDINGLGIDNYTLTLTDSINATFVLTGLSVTGPTVLVASGTKVDNTCYDSFNGSITINTTGGTSPFMYKTTGPNGFISISKNLTGLDNGTYTTTIIDANSSTASFTTTINSNNPQLLLTQASAAQLNKQCDSTQYAVPIYISAGLSNGQTAYISYQIDNGTWNNTSLTFVNSSTPMILYIPKASMNTNVKVKFSNTSTYACYSNTINYLVNNMKLPLATLTITPDSSINLKQCSTSIINIGFELNDTTRAPYNVTYSVNGVAKPSVSVSPSSTLTPNVITTTPVGASTTQIINMTVTDNVGCTDTKTFNIIMPSTNLTGNITTAASGGQYAHTITASGGIGTKTGIPYNLGVVTNNSSTITTTIKDSVGCIVTVTG
jgi:hypothetical protein